MAVSAFTPGKLYRTTCIVHKKVLKDSVVMLVEFKEHTKPGLRTSFQYSRTHMDRIFIFGDFKFAVCDDSRLPHWFVGPL